MIIAGLTAFDVQPRTRIVFENGALSKVGALAVELGFRRALLVADKGMKAAGYVEQAKDLLASSGVEVVCFHDFDTNPDSRMVEAGKRVGAEHRIDSLVALGGGSSLDCAKGINFLVTGGGSMRDYRGYGKVRGPMLPMIGIPTTAGTGSEAQSYAIISDAETHAKMACGDPGAAFRVAILDPLLTVTQPRSVTAIAGYDALSHAVESFVTRKRTTMSDVFAREAWLLLAAYYARVLTVPDDIHARGAMLIGAHLAGSAIELSMLGATHACANALTARFGTTHGVAIAVMLQHVVRWNAPACGERYAELLAVAAADVQPGAEPKTPSQIEDNFRSIAAETLARKLDELARMANLPASLRDVGAVASDIPGLADEAATQWTGTFNPRPFDRAAAVHLFEAAY